MSSYLSSATPQVKRFLCGALLNSLGGGLTLPILVVYLNQVRGLSMTSASVVLSWMAIVGLLSSPAIGSLVDHFGPRVIMLCAIAIEAIGTVSWGHVHTIGQAYGVAAIVAHGGCFTTRDTDLGHGVSLSLIR